jgi:hypothetical protein
MQNYIEKFNFCNIYGFRFYLGRGKEKKMAIKQSSAFIFLGLKIVSLLIKSVDFIYSTELCFWKFCRIILDSNLKFASSIYIIYRSIQQTKQKSIEV